jgi:hypothetical protein
MSRCNIILLCAWVMWSKSLVYDTTGNNLRLENEAWGTESAYPEQGYSKCIADTKVRAERMGTSADAKNGKFDSKPLIGGGYMASIITDRKTFIFEYKCFPDTVKPQ